MVPLFATLFQRIKVLRKGVPPVYLVQGEVFYHFLNSKRQLMHRKEHSKFHFSVSLIVSRGTMSGRFQFLIYDISGLKVHSQSFSNMRTVGQVYTIFNFENNLTSFHFEMIVKDAYQFKICVIKLDLNFIF